MSKASTSESDTGTVIDLDALFTLQLERCETLKQILKNFKKDPNTRKTRVYCQVRLEKIEAVHGEFNKTHTTIVHHDTSRKSQYFTDRVASEFEERYFDSRVALLEAYNEQTPSSSEQSAGSQLQVPKKMSPIEMPKLPLPSFSGKYIEWPAFHDAFVRLIHTNTDLSAIQKFHFLKKALPAENDVDVQQMALTETNYGTAWDLFVNRYNNPRLLFMHHMNKLFTQSAVTKECSDDIKSLLNVAKVCINEFSRLKIPISQGNQWIAYLLSTKLPKDTHHAWEYHLGSDVNIPTFEMLEAFLNKRLVKINVIENRNISCGNNSLSKTSNVADTTSSTKRQSRPPKALYRHNSNSFHATSQPKNVNSCFLCGEAHILRRCTKFLAKDCFERKSIADKEKLCLNCLSRAHSVSRCTSTKNCLQCSQRHHTLLHFPMSKPPQQNESPRSHEGGKSQIALNPSAQTFQVESTQSQTTTHQNPTSSRLTHTAQLLTEPSQKQTRKVLLATALVTIKNDGTGQSMVVRALLDQGSECTLISEHAVQTLCLTRNRASADISGVGSNVAHRCKHTVNFTMHSYVNPNYHVAVNTAFVLKALTNKLPSQTIEPNQWAHIRGLQLADMFANLLLPETRIGGLHEPIAQRTHLGWILSGNTTSTPKVDAASLHCNHVTLELESLVQRFFEIDQVPTERSLSQEENWCETHFQQTHMRQPNGKYLVRLPLKNLFDESQTLGKSKKLALNRFHSLERKLQRNDELRARYEGCIREYFTLNQITPATTTEEQHSVKLASSAPTVASCVLPHHAVIKEESLTTKLRIVFDASCKTSNGKSLNDVLCVGPALQNDLPAVVLNWRKHKFAFTSDIQKMYRCIDMHTDDSQYQRILWRNEANEIQEYCLTTVTFGTASAPYTAIRILHQLAEDESTSCPLAAPVLRNEMYVDYVLSGGHSVEIATEIRKQVTLALRSAGMELRKWSSNSSAVLDGIPTENRSDSNALQLNSSDTVKTLGILWQPNKDVFKFRLNFEIDFTATKRSVLSTIARLYDPLGLIAPVIVAAKIILKSVWSFKVQRDEHTFTPLAWDETLPTNLNHQWQRFLNTVSELPCITLPRWLNYEPNHVKSLQLHVFCDGSTAAYAACVYLRSHPDKTVDYTTRRVVRSSAGD
ncbi:uncharacterized protein LOC118741830 [Rhagoletis pomonella]|uniref:uncharacterized protein LOC118741830 n=1 Tax=Rhagoletis pomonella TaxID=28610 RepID=UPI00177FF4A0|nr:uncharacterized protein LOC118741830 [Rhagoletis pomonella]